VISSCIFGNCYSWIQCKF